MTSIQGDVCALLGSQRYPRRIYYRNLPPCRARALDSDFEARFCCHGESRIGKSSRSSGELEIDLTFRRHLSVPSSFTSMYSRQKWFWKIFPRQRREKHRIICSYIMNAKWLIVTRASVLLLQKRFLGASHKSRFSGRIQLIAASWKWSSGVINGPSLCQLCRIPRYIARRATMPAVKKKKNEKEHGRTEKFSRLLKWKSAETAGIVSGNRCHFREWHSYRAFSPHSLARGARRPRAYRVAGRRRGIARVTLYVSYSEMFMRPVQRPITKMTIKINYSHHAAIATACRPPITPCRLARWLRIRDAEIVGGTNQFT